MLTIGMAHFEDFDGVYFTVQSLRMHHADDNGRMPDTELIVVDNSPNTQHGEMIRGLLSKVTNGGSFDRVQYIPVEEVIGTSATRQRIFDSANGSEVLVMDCHVLLVPEALSRLRQYYTDNPQTNDLLSGPLILDTLREVSTHFSDTWGAEMWGRWGSGWRCGCGRRGTHFQMLQIEDTAKPRAISMGDVPVKKCKACGQKIPLSFGWGGHEIKLLNKGYVILGLDTNDPPFEIPGMGLGLFTCRKDAWLGFNEHSRGFGGEEMYIHEKFRQAGHKALCLPFLQWLHRFGRVGGAKYPLTNWNKCRNYVLEFNELGLDLEPVKRTFLDTEKVTQEMWNLLMDDAIENEIEPHVEKAGCGGCGKPKELVPQDADEAFDNVSGISRDLEQHMPKLKELAGLVDRVTEFSIRRESTIAFLAARTKSFKSYNSEFGDRLTAGVFLGLRNSESNGRVLHSSGEDSPTVESIEETDLLFLNTQHTRDRVLSELEKFGTKTTRFIVLHSTQIFGERGEDGGPGIRFAMRDFMGNHKEWSVIYHTVDQYGLTVLGCQKQDKPPLPSKWQMAKNLMGAVKDIVLDGAEARSPQEYEAALMQCSICDQRHDARCAACGCLVAEKARYRNQQCPLGKWEV